VTDAKLCLSYNKNSKSIVSLQGTYFVKGANGTDVTVRYPAGSATPTYLWTGKIYKIAKNEKAGEAKVNQDKDVAEKDKRDITDEVSITVGATTVKVMADIYEE
jgi:hypothetical protein